MADILSDIHRRFPSSSERHFTSKAPLASRHVRVRRPEQPKLPFDPMPARIEPCLAQLVDKPPKGDQWSFEIKWDGYRMAVHVEPHRVRVLSRNGHDWTDRVPSIVAEVRQIAGTMILDGEAVVLDDQGRSDFGALQKAFGGRGGKGASSKVILYAFDLLYLDGHDLTKTGLHERREMLENRIGGRIGAIRLSETIEADGDVLFEQVCALGLEGIIAKNRDRPYRSGRTGDWLKIKCVQSERFLIIDLSSRPPVSAAWVGAAGGAAGRSPRLCRRRRNGLHGRLRNCAPKADGQNRDFRTGGGHREEAAECDIGSARARPRDRV